MASSQVTDMQRHSVADDMSAAGRSVGKDSYSRGMTHNPALRSDLNRKNLHRVSEEGSSEEGTPVRADGAEGDEEYPSMQDLIEEAKEKDNARDRLRTDINLADST